VTLGTLQVVMQAIGQAMRLAVSRQQCQVAVVQLTGSLDWDERSALKVISRQLCNAFGLTFVASASFEENMLFFRDVLSHMKSMGRSAVFVLEELHLFLKRPRPTTVYNLLDSLQSYQVQSVVIGVTTELFALDHMEKRARSRFSHRQVELHLPCDVFEHKEVRSRPPLSSGRHRCRRSVPSSCRLTKAVQPG
jgi:hypothetical protein